jgi:hypothetical protein
MTTPSDLIEHYSSKAFLTRISALTFVGAVVGAVLNRLDDPALSTIVGLALIFVVTSLAELNLRYAHSYLCACYAASLTIDSDTPEGKVTAERWQKFRFENEKKWKSPFRKFLLYWLTYLPGLVLGEYLVLKNGLGYLEWLSLGLGLLVFAWWVKSSFERMQVSTSQDSDKQGTLQIEEKDSVISSNAAPNKSFQPTPR